MRNKNPNKNPKNTGKGTSSKNIGPVRIPPKVTCKTAESDSNSEPIKRKANKANAGENNKRKDTIWRIIPIVISIVALTFSALTYFHTMEKDNMEKVIITTTDENSYYFDGQSLFINYSVCISNNSYIPVSMTNIDIKRNGMPENYKITTDEQIPINIDNNHSVLVAFQGTIELDDGITALLLTRFGKEVRIDEADYAGFILSCDLIEDKTSMLRHQYTVNLLTAKGNTFSITFEKGRHIGFGGHSNGHGAGMSF